MPANPPPPKTSIRSFSRFGVIRYLPIETALGWACTFARRSSGLTKATSRSHRARRMAPGSRHACRWGCLREETSTDTLTSALLGKQSFIFLLDDRVTFAGSLLEARTVQHGDATTRVADQSRIL